MSKLTRDSFTTVPELPRKTVEVPALGGTACVRRMTAGERSQYQNALIRFGPDGEREFVIEFADIRLAVLTLIDEDTGERVFGDVDEGVAILGKHDSATVDTIVTAARELNPLNKEEVDEAVDALKS